MNNFNLALERDLSSIAALKKDLVNVEELLEDKTVGTDNIISTVEQRERQMDEL